MSPEDVQQRIAAGLPDCEITVTGDGSHFEVIAVGEVFAGLTPVKKQQLVYGTVNDLITSGELHALTIKAYTPAEWEQARKLQISS
ncbi:MAG TPA: BolA family transcriptional regulator [Gammaproteobacteria bacterium]|nr:BolA family transcriptional regulator [Gammaproteobacteria bacterium]